MAVFLSLILVVIAAVSTVACVRYAEGAKRVALFSISMLCLTASIYWGDSLGGFWPGLFTVLTAYMLLCIALPWIDLARRRYVG